MYIPIEEVVVPHTSAISINSKVNAKSHKDSNVYIRRSMQKKEISHIICRNQSRATMTMAQRDPLI